MKNRKRTLSSIFAALIAVSLMGCSFSSDDGPSKKSVNKTALATAIEAAVVANASAEVGTDVGDVPAEAKTALEDAIDSAQAVYDDSGATQAEVDAAVSALSAAQTAFLAAIIGESVSLTELSAAIDSAADLKTAHSVGDQDGNVPQAAMDSLTAAIAAAQDVLDDADVTQTEADAAVTALNAASAAFEASIIGNTVLRSTLQSALNSANALNTATSVGTAAGNVPEAAKTTFTAAIAAAQAVYDDADATQEEIDGAVTALNAAKADFQSAIILADKTALSAKITAATTLLSSAEIGDEVGEVAQAAHDALAEAIASATAVRDSAASTQAQVDAAVTALNAASAAFEAEIIEDIVIDVSIDPVDAMYLVNSDGTAPDFTRGLVNWDTSSVITEDVTTDATYGHALQAANGTGWGTAVAFNGFDKGVFAEYTTLRFKLKTGQAQFKVQLAPTEVVMNPLSESEYVTAIEGGWLQVEIPLSAFGTTGLTSTQLGFYDHANCTFLITDVCLSGTPATVNTAGLVAEIASASTFNDAHVIGTEDGNVSEADKDAFDAAIAAAQAVVDSTPATQAEVTAAITALAAARASFSDAILVLVPTTLPAAPTLEASAVISLLNTSGTYTDIAVGNWNPNWGQGGTISDYSVADTGKTIKKMNLVNYQGVNLCSADGGVADGTMSIAGKSKLHISYLSFNATALEVFPINASTEYSINVTSSLTSDGTWQELDIEFDNGTFDLTTLRQLKFVGSGVFFFDNVYFH